TIVAATSHFAASRQFLEPAAYRARPHELCGQGPVLSAPRSPEHSIEQHISPKCWLFDGCYWTVGGGSIVTILRHLLVVFLTGVASAISVRHLIAGALFALFAASGPAGAVSEFGSRDEAVAMVHRVQDMFKKLGAEGTFQAIKRK